MNRRAFLQQIYPLTDPPRPEKKIKYQVDEGLEPFTPSDEQPWDRRRAAHLLRRARMGAPSPEDIDTFAALTPDEAVEKLFDFPSDPRPPLWTRKPLSLSVSIAFIRMRIIDLIEWWLSLMAEDGSIRERMVYFWSNHFVVELGKVLNPVYLYRLNRLFRDYAVGNWRELTKRVGKEPAMLVYLDGVENIAGNINENYARELQELFTIGRDNYTQEDVREAARALTGWRIRLLNCPNTAAYVDSDLFDDGEKTFYGQTGHWGADDIVDIIFQQEETARFMARALYRHFVYTEPDEQIVSELADVMREHDYDIETTLKRLLKSAHFMSDDFIGADVKSPIDLVMGTLSQLGLTGINYRQVGELLLMLGQLPFAPPNVAGWPEHRSWVTATTLPLRQIMGSFLLYGVSGWPAVNMQEIAQRYSRMETPEEIVDRLVEDLLSFGLAENEVDYLADMLVEDGQGWSPETETGQEQLRKLIAVITQLAEYQLR